MAFSGTGTASGALGGAASGAMLGSVVPGIGTAVGAGVGALVGGLGGSGLFGGGSSSSVPSFNPQQALALEQQQYAQMAPQATGFASNLFDQAAQEGQRFAKQGTTQQINLQNLVTPGSSAQREAALNQINSYIQGQIPQDVQQNINRQVAQNLGGGFNLFSGGGQAPQNFARNIGQTSLGLSQYGLSAAPTWQQLANTMVVSPTVGLSGGLQAGQIGTQLAQYAAGQGNQLAESQYQGAFNQYQGQQLQNQMQNQMALGMGQLGLQGYSAMNQANYLNSLGGQGINASNISGMLPSVSGAQATMSQLGYPAAGSGFTALPNTGAGIAYPFGIQ